MTTTADGEFWRLLVDGTYIYTVHAFDYDSSAPASVVVENSVDGSGVKGVNSTEIQQNFQRGVISCCISKLLKITDRLGEICADIAYPWSTQFG